MELDDRVKILVDGAKYDVSCSSSGSATAGKRGELGSAALGGICHSFASDGRCISLMKILMSNKCEFDCSYCVNRKSSDTPRASISPRELAEIVYNFYRRNYIEGLFLSSAVDGSPNATMQRLIEAVEILRFEYKFNGYIHLKAIPGADKTLLDYATVLADRMSMNIELPSEKSLNLLAPQKKKELILLPMKQMANLTTIPDTQKIIPFKGPDGGNKTRKPIPAGQTTQMIIGATPDSDGQILRLSQSLYRLYKLKRVYYSAYSPVGDNKLLPVLPAPLKRENRLYQADWLLRFYGFDADEIASENGDLSLELDPKCDWATRNLDKFPVEINRASYEQLLRVPGIGVRNAWRIVNARKNTPLSYEDLKRMRVTLKRAINFITIQGKYYGFGITERLRDAMIKKENPRVQMSFDELAPLTLKDTEEEKNSKSDLFKSLVMGEF